MPPLRRPAEPARRRAGRVRLARRSVAPAGDGPPSQGRSGRPDPAGPAAALPLVRPGEPAFRCPVCGVAAAAGGVVGAGRTAEELGRAFPGRDGAHVGWRRRRCSTGCPAGPRWWSPRPGAEPPAEGGYGAALLLDGWALLARPDLRVAEETLRRWLGAAALVVPAADGGRLGRVVVVADAGLPPVQALVRWDPAWHAGRELAARREVGFPPAVRMASVEGAASRRGRGASTPCSATGPPAGRGPRTSRCSARSSCDPEPGADPAAPPPRTSPGARAARAGPRAGGGARRGGGPALGAQGARPGPGAAGPAGGRLTGRASGPAESRPRRGGTSGQHDVAESGRPAAPPRRRRHPLPDDPCPPSSGIAPPQRDPRSPAEPKEIRARPARPALRRPGAAHPRRGGDDLRRGAAPAGRGPDRHDARGARRRPRRAAARRRAAGVHLRLRRVPGHLVNPTFEPVGDEEQAARRAACRSPGCPWTAAGT